MVKTWQVVLYMHEDEMSFDQINAHLLGSLSLQFDSTFLFPERRKSIKMSPEVAKRFVDAVPSFNRIMEHAKVVEYRSIKLDSNSKYIATRKTRIE